MVNAAAGPSNSNQEVVEVVERNRSVTLCFVSDNECWANIFHFLLYISVVLKVGMIGDSQIGKTSMMVKYVEGSFDEDYIQTLGV